MRLKEILESIKEEYGKERIFEERYDLSSFWITPDNEFLEIPDTHHYNWILINHEEFDLNILDILDIDEETAREYGFGRWEDIPTAIVSEMDYEIFPEIRKRGWVRGGYLKSFTGEVVFELQESRLSKRLIDKMVSVINDIFSNPSYHLEVKFEVYTGGGNVEYKSMEYQDFLYIESKRGLMDYKSLV